MADEASVSIAIDLEGNVSEVAKDDAQALRDLKASISASTAELGNMNKALRALKAGGAVSEATIAKLKGQIAATKATIAQSTAAFVKAGGSFKTEARPIESAKGSIARLMAEFSGLPGPIGTVISKLGGLGKVLAIGATVAFAAALVAVAAAAASAAMSLAGYALSIANARRNEDLRLQGLSKYRNFWAEMVTGQGRIADSSSFLQKQLDDVASSSALGRDRIAEMQAELYRAGLRSGNLQAALEGLAIAESTQGAEGAAQFKARALGVALFGGSVKKVSDDIKARLGGIAKAQLLSLDVQVRKMRENFALLLKDLHIEPLLEAISHVTAMFSQSTASGRALKALLETAFQPLGDAAAKYGILVKRFFQGVIIGALEFGIAIQRLRIYLKETFGGNEFLKSLDMQAIAVKAGTAAFFLLVGAIAAGAAIAGLLAIALGSVVAGLGAVGAMVGLAIGALIDYGSRAVKLFQRTSWTDIGLAIPRGIAAGIRAGFGLVTSAMADMGNTAMAYFGNIMRIHSPSQVARDMALNVPRGVAVGIHAGAPMVRRASAGMADATQQGMRAGYDRIGGPPEAAPQEMPRAPARAGAKSMTLNVHEGAIRIDGAGKAAGEIAREVMAQIEEMFVSASRELAAGDVT